MSKMHLKMEVIEGHRDFISATRIKVRPEHRRELCLTISALVDRIRREQGCRSYTFFGEVEDQNSLMLIGEWDTPASWESHLNSENFAVLVGSLKLLTTSSSLDFNLLERVSAFDARAQCEPSKEAQFPSLIN